MRVRFAFLGLIGTILGLAPAPRAEASVGFRAGFSLTPDQVVLGVHNNIAKDLIPGTRLVLPVVELGLGDHLTRLSGATDLLVMLPHLGNWQLYAGGELALHLFFADGNNANNLGVGGILGIDRQVGNDARVGFEFKLGFVDSPDAGLLLLYTFSGSTRH